MLKNKIQAKDTNISMLLKDQKFTIDYFQREYRWQEKHIKSLVDDLTSTFIKSYNPEHKRSEVANYQNYYLGPAVFSLKDGKKSIIDGQQRITSITLLLIYLNNLQKNTDNIVPIGDLIFSEKYGEKSFNMSDNDREDVLKLLFDDGEYTRKENDNDTVINIVDRYENISEFFPEEIDRYSLPYFIDWLIENVKIVEIIAYSDENAYTIFETMNDRGLNLTATEMLKGYVLSRMNIEQRTEIDNIWKNEVNMLQSIGENMDIIFFQSWLRSKFATTIRQSKAGSDDQDFELIGSRFNNWFKDNHVNLNLVSSEEFYNFFKNQFPFFTRVFRDIYNAQNTYVHDLKHLYFIRQWGIGESLQNALLLSSINFGDNNKTINIKLDAVARYIETFTVLRASNYKKFGASSIKHTVFNLIKLFRGNDIELLVDNIKDEISTLFNPNTNTEPLSWNNITELRLHGQNKIFIKHLLCRITNYVDELSQKNTTYVSYQNPKDKPFEIEHIWANKFEEHKNDFSQNDDFIRARNNIGALVLLPRGTNQSFSSDKYEDKIKFYIRETNSYIQSLNSDFYKKNPNFLNNKDVQELNFKSYHRFKKEDILERSQLVKNICEKIWSVDYFDNIQKSYSDSIQHLEKSIL